MERQVIIGVACAFIGILALLYFFCGCIVASVVTSNEENTDSFFTIVKKWYMYLPARRSDDLPVQ
jgi:hypothetical protein